MTWGRHEAASGEGAMERWMKRVIEEKERREKARRAPDEEDGESCRGIDVNGNPSYPSAQPLSPLPLFLFKTPSNP